MTLSGSNKYTGNTTVSAGEVRANNASSSTGSGTVTVASGATLGGSGVISNGTNALAVNGTITAGGSSTTVGTLTTGTEAWNANGAFAVKTTSTGGNTTVATNDELVMSGLTVSSPFNVSVSGLSDSTTTFISTSLGYLILADDTEGASTNPFSDTNSSATLAKLVLVTPGVMVPKGYRLVTASDSAVAASSGGTNRGGYSLLLVAAPEPASLVLVSGAVVPLLLGRRNRRGIAI